MAERAGSIGQKTDFGRELKAWRHRMRMTQGQLADALGYDVTYVVKIESATRPPTRQFLARLAQLPGEALSALSHASAGDISRPQLPRAPDALIGREGEVKEVVDLLLGSARCVTLAGPPGIGKTRLAMEVAARVDAVFTDGSWWVSLLEVNEPQEVAGHVAQTLGIRIAGSADPLEAVVSRLRSERALLVLDNFEHVMGAFSVVSRLLSAAPRLTALVTSRETLGITSEHVHIVRPLPFPRPELGPSLEEVQRSPAVELFVTRLRMARPRFHLGERNFTSVLETCARVDGIPLAIVLTAGVLAANPGTSVAQVGEPLEGAAASLVDAPTHHRTLESAILRSWTPLSPEEQRLLATLAVFSGGFTADAVRAVAEGVPAGPPSLNALVRKSLLEARPDAPSGPRCELLATIRAFARARLHEQGRTDDVHRRHVSYFVDFAEEASQRLIGPDQVDAVTALVEDYDNLRVAFEWALPAESDEAIRLAASLWRFFLLRDIPTGRDWLERALVASPSPSPCRAMALAGAGALAWVTGHFDTAARRLADARFLAGELDLPAIAALAALNEGALAGQQDRLDDADASFGDALRIYDELQDRRGRAACLIGMGMIRRWRGHADQAGPLWTEAATLMRAVGDRFNEAIALDNLAWAAEREGRLREAQEWAGQCRRIQIAVGDARGLATTMATLGRIAAKRGDSAEAERLSVEALSTFHRLGDRPSAATTLVSIAAIAWQRGHDERALALAGAAETLWAEMGEEPHHEERVLLDDMLADIRCRLDAAPFARWIGAGRAITLDDAVDLAKDAPAAMV